MNKDEHFQHEREAFRIWISDKDERQLELLKSDIQLREFYLKKIKQESFFPWTN